MPEEMIKSTMIVLQNDNQLYSSTAGKCNCNFVNQTGIKRKRILKAYIKYFARSKFPFFKTELQTHECT